MIVLRNFIGSEDTFIVGEYVSIGYFYSTMDGISPAEYITTHIDSLPMVLEGTIISEDISDDMKSQIEVAHRGNATIPEDWSSLLEDPRDIVRELAMANLILLETS